MSAPPDSAGSSEPFHDPHVALGKIYTKGGDKGETSLVGGQRVPKDAPRIEAYGTVDELNAVVGMVRAEVVAVGGMAELERQLLRVQHQLFNLGSALSTLKEDLHPKQPRISDQHVQELEDAMDEANTGLPGLTSFILPGADRLDGLWHLARTICRRAERQTVKLLHEAAVDPVDVRYLNRLSDACFVWGRWCLHRRGIAPTLWDPNEG